MRCKDFCPLANPDLAKIKPLVTGSVTASSTDKFEKPVEFNFREEEFDKGKITLKPIDSVTTPVPSSGEANCELPKNLSERARDGGAGTFTIYNCPYHPDPIHAFAARA